MINEDKGFLTISENLINSGYKCYAVGGCVRDELLGKEAFDVDVCTDASPEETEKVFANFRVIETGIKHGTVSVIVNGKIYEITTFRSDGEYLDNRHPSGVKFIRSLDEDLARRDFTVNALAKSADGEIVDLFGGQKDIKNKIIKCVGEPNKRFQEDALRILRALRFSSTLGFKVEENTKNSIIKNKSLLKNISAERINAEFTKLLLGDNVKEVLMEYHEVICEIFPCLEQCYEFDQHSRNHCYDVYEHIATSVGQAKKNVEIRYAMLLHDVGKPICFVTDEDGVGHFPNHANVGAQIAKDALSSIKTDKKTLSSVVTLIGYHDAMLKPTDSSVKKWLRLLGANGFRQLLEVQKADAKAHAELAKDERLSNVIEVGKVFNEILSRHDCYNLKALGVNGYDVANFGVKGESIGKYLEILLDKVISGELPNVRAELLKELTKIINGEN